MTETEDQEETTEARTPDRRVPRYGRILHVGRTKPRKSLEELDGDVTIFGSTLEES